MSFAVVYVQAAIPPREPQGTLAFVVCVHVYAFGVVDTRIEVLRAEIDSPLAIRTSEALRANASVHLHQILASGIVLTGVSKAVVNIPFTSFSLKS